MSLNSKFLNWIDNCINFEYFCKLEGPCRMWNVTSVGAKDGVGKIEFEPANSKND